MLTRLGLRQSHGRYSGEALEEAIHLAKDRRWRTRKMIHLPSIALFVGVQTTDRVSLCRIRIERRVGRRRMPFFKMYGQADRTSLAVYVLREGSHVVHGRTDPSLMEYREGSDVVLDWHCM